MTVLALLRFAWPYLLTAMLGGGITGWLTHRGDSIAYNRLQAEYAGYQAKVSDAQADAEKAAREAVQAEMDKREMIEVNNAHVMQDLQSQLDTAAADRDFARRLLAAAQKAGSAADSDQVSAAANRSGSDGSRGASGDRSFTDDLAAAAGEARICFQRLDALQREVKPQL